MAAESAPPRERMIEVAGLGSRIWEKGEGDRLVFLAGLGGLARWTPCLDALAQEHHVIVPSLPGFPGGTGHELLDTTLDWATATLDLIEAAGGVDADWVGVSIGASLAAEAAALGRGCRRLALIAPLGLFDEGDPVADVWAQTPGSQAALLCAREESLAWIEPDGTDPIEAQVIKVRAQAAAARLLWPTSDTGLEKRLHRIQAPTLLMRGAEDRVLPESYLERIAAGIASETRIATVEGAGHLADLDAPGRCAEMLLAHFS